MTCQLEIDFEAPAENRLQIDLDTKEITLPSDIGRTPVTTDEDVISILRKIRKDYRIDYLDDWKVRIKDVYLIIEQNRIAGVRL